MERRGGAGTGDHHRTLESRESRTGRGREQDPRLRHAATGSCGAARRRLRAHAAGAPTAQDVGAGFT